MDVEKPDCLLDFESVGYLQELWELRATIMEVYDEFTNNVVDEHHNRCEFSIVYGVDEDVVHVMIANNVYAMSVYCRYD